MDNYKILGTIGSGRFGKVKLALDVNLRQPVALKILKKDENTASIIETEVTIHSQLSHPHIIHLYNYFNYHGHVCLCLEYACGGELFDRLSTSRGLSEPLALHFFLQLLDVLEYLHGIGCCHRDIKPENMLLDINGDLKIGDFGLATKFLYDGRKITLTEKCGSLLYVAPEVLMGRYHGDSVDIWSAGVFLYVLVSGLLPWHSPSWDSEEFSNVMRGNYNFKPWTQFSPALHNLLIRMLDYDPEKRIKLGDIKVSQWVNQEDIISKYKRSGNCSSFVNENSMVTKIIQEFERKILAPMYRMVRTEKASQMNLEYLENNTQAAVTGNEMFLSQRDFDLDSDVGIRASLEEASFSQPTMGDRPIFFPMLTVFGCWIHPDDVIRAVKRFLESIDGTYQVIAGGDKLKGSVRVRASGMADDLLSFTLRVKNAAEDSQYTCMVELRRGVVRIRFASTRKRLI